MCFYRGLKKIIRKWRWHWQSQQRQLQWLAELTQLSSLHAPNQLSQQKCIQTTEKTDWFSSEFPLHSLLRQRLAVMDAWVESTRYNYLSLKWTLKQGFYNRNYQTNQELIFLDVGFFFWMHIVYLFKNVFLQVRFLMLLYESLSFLSLSLSVCLCLSVCLSLSLSLSLYFLHPM